MPGGLRRLRGGVVTAPLSAAELEWAIGEAQERRAAGAKGSIGTSDRLAMALLHLHALLAAPLPEELAEIGERARRATCSDGRILGADVPRLLAALRVALHGIATQAATIREREAERDAAARALSDTAAAHVEAIRQRDAAVTLAKAERAYRVACESFLSLEGEERAGQDAIVAAMAALRAAGGEP